MLDSPSRTRPHRYQQQMRQMRRCHQRLCLPHRHHHRHHPTEDLSVQPIEQMQMQRERERRGEICHYRSFPLQYFIGKKRVFIIIYSSRAQMSFYHFLFFFSLFLTERRLISFFSSPLLRRGRLGWELLIKSKSCLMN